MALGAEQQTPRQLRVRLGGPSQSVVSPFVIFIREATEWGWESHLVSDKNNGSIGLTVRSALQNPLFKLFEGLGIGHIKH